MAWSYYAVQCYSCEKPGHPSSGTLAVCTFVFYGAKVVPPPFREPTGHADREIHFREEVTDADELNSSLVRVPPEREDLPLKEKSPPKRDGSVPPSEGAVPSKEKVKVKERSSKKHWCGSSRDHKRERDPERDRDQE